MDVHAFYAADNTGHITTSDTAGTDPDDDSWHTSYTWLLSITPAQSTPVAPGKRLRTITTGDTATTAPHSPYG